MPIILEFRRLRQDRFKFKTNLNYSVRLFKRITFLVGSRVHILRLRGPVYVGEMECQAEVKPLASMVYVMGLLWQGGRYTPLAWTVLSHHCLLYCLGHVFH